MTENNIITMSSDDKHSHHESLAFDQENGSQIVVDAAAERSYCQCPSKRKKPAKYPMLTFSSA
jgi:hypothetical protein